jgi:hypothetical protein
MKYLYGESEKISFGELPPLAAAVDDCQMPIKPDRIAKEHVVMTAI